MMTYALALLAVISLCAFWAIFQVWLSRHDPDASRRSMKCGNCGCEEQCDGSDAARKL